MPITASSASDSLIPPQATSAHSTGCALRRRPSRRGTRSRFAQALADTELIEAGPVHLDIVFGVGPTRSWLNLWKPTVDALGALLGQPCSSRAWHPTTAGSPDSASTDGRTTPSASTSSFSSWRGRAPRDAQASPRRWPHHNATSASAAMALLLDERATPARARLRPERALLRGLLPQRRAVGLPAKPGRGGVRFGQ